MRILHNLYYNKKFITMKKTILAMIILSVFAAFGCQPSSGQVKKYDPKRKMSKTPAEWKKY